METLIEVCSGVCVYMCVRVCVCVRACVCVCVFDAVCCLCSVMFSLCGWGALHGVNPSHPLHHFRYSKYKVLVDSMVSARSNSGSGLTGYIMVCHSNVWSKMLKLM